MIAIDDTTTIGEAFARSAQAFAVRPFLAAPVNADRNYCRTGYEIDYATAADQVRALVEGYRSAGYGHGHRVALLMENRPEQFLHKLALNTIGAICVPINPDYRAGEIAYLIDSSATDLAVAAQDQLKPLALGVAAADHKPPLVGAEEFGSGVPKAKRAADKSPVSADTIASILYTSGTTGRPKGCLLSHGYELASGRRYASLGHRAAFLDGGDRVYTPLPLYHVNSFIVSFLGLMQTGNCQIQTDRFHPQRWWSEVKQTRATVIHYLGIIVPLLLNRSPAPEDRDHAVRFGIGVGVEPTIHANFEQRFGFPLVEVWGMTEMVRLLSDNIEPRQVGTRAFGRAIPGIEVRVVDDNDRDVADGSPGEMVLRHSAQTPRKHFFSGYLNDEQATESAWKGGWFHTGDTVWRGGDGMLHFVDRKKNIIRRSGENIAAAEIEAVLQAHEDVAQVAVLAVSDDLREEEVLACIVLARDLPLADAANRLFDHCFAELAYFKAPGWVYFTDKLPTTGTQKIQKHQIFPAGTDPRVLPGMFDLRDRKKREKG